MKNKLFIHIGMNKTGSSAIQAFLTLNLNTLKQNSFIYPDPPKFTQAFQTNSGNGVGFANAINNKNINDFKKYINRHINDHNLILSSEVLFQSLSHQKECFFQIIEEYDYRIICYVRRQDNLLSSCYNQVLKNHDFKETSINEMMLSSNDFGKTLLDCLDYTTADRIIVKPYEKQQFHGESIYSDFLNTLGLAMGENYILPNEVINPSLNWETLEFRRILNELEVDFENVNSKRTINSLLAKYTVDQNKGRAFQDSNIFSYEQRKRILERFEEKNRMVAKIFLDRIEEPLFMDPIPKGDSEWVKPNKLNLEKTIDICSYLLKQNDYTEQDLIKEIARTTANLLILKNPGNNEQNNATLLYCLTKKPKQVSKDIAAFQKRNNLWRIESTGKDPFFILPDFHNENEGKRLLVEVRIKVPFETTLQVFYTSKNEKFSQNKCVGQKLTKGFNDISLQIQADKKIEELRLDPGNKEGVYLLENLEVLC